MTSYQDDPWDVDGEVGHWQTGYGVVRFGTANLAWVKAYIRNQRGHHHRGTIQERLERITEIEDSEA